MLENPLRRAWCRLVHFRYWTALDRPWHSTVRLLWLRCGICNCQIGVTIRIVPAPPGKTPTV